MSAQFDRSHTAQVVDMVSLLDDSSRKRVVTSPEKKKSATLLSIRQNLNYKACIGVDNIDHVRTRCSQDLANALIMQLRGFLNDEFGRLRVHRFREAFTVGHHNLENLVGGLLRVQFYARQVETPVSDSQLQPRLLLLSWGVGESVMEAEHERQRRQRLKD